MYKDLSHQFSTMLEEIHKLIKDKDPDVVVSVLTLLLANTGMANSFTPESLISHITQVILGVYVENDPSDETIH